MSCKLAVYTNLWLVKLLITAFQCVLSRKTEIFIWLYREKAILDMIARVIGVVCKELRC